MWLVSEAKRYFLSLFSDQLRSAASVFSTCLVGCRRLLHCHWATSKGHLASVHHGSIQVFAMADKKRRTGLQNPFRRVGNQLTGVQKDGVVGARLTRFSCNLSLAAAVYDVAKLIG
jgi:hypothetical protein